MNDESSITKAGWVVRESTAALPPIHHLPFTIQNFVEVSRLGLEPRTPALKGQCSTVELPAHVGCSQGSSFSNPAADGQDAAPFVIQNGKTPKGGLALHILTTYTSGTAPVNTNRSGRDLSYLTGHESNCTLLKVNRTLERLQWRQFASTSKR